MNDTTAAIPSVSPDQGKNEKSEKTSSPIGNALGRFLKAIEDFRDAAIVGGPAVGKWQISEIEKQNKIISKFIREENEHEITAVAHDPQSAKEMLSASKELSRLRHSKPVKALMKSLFIGIFSEYDVFIGELLKAFYSSKPELFKSIKREVSLSDLLEFSSVDAVKQDILDSEIDSFRRNSYVEQFAELEKKFEISTLRSFPEWSKFVELGQRRNLLTHNGGLCSEQYLSVCDRTGYKFESRPSCGDDLMPSGKYFTDSLFIIAKVAFMLTHTLWRKILPDDIEVADSEMNNTIFELLSKEWWRHSAEFGKFGLGETISRKTTDINRRIRVINTAIGLKHSSRNDEAMNLLKSLDWSASLRDFRLAIAVLREEYDEAIELMKSVGKSGEMIDQLAYHTWPLFHEFRNSESFQKAYEEVYERPFIEQATKEAQTQIIDGVSLVSEINISSRKPKVEESNSEPMSVTKGTSSKSISKTNAPKRRKVSAS